MCSRARDNTTFSPHPHATTVLFKPRRNASSGVDPRPATLTRQIGHVVPNSPSRRSRTDVCCHSCAHASQNECPFPHGNTTGRRYTPRQIPHIHFPSTASMNESPFVVMTPLGEIERCENVPIVRSRVSRRFHVAGASTCGARASGEWRFVSVSRKRRFV